MRNVHVTIIGVPWSGRETFSYIRDWGLETNNIPIIIQRVVSVVNEFRIESRIDHYRFSTRAREEHIAPMKMKSDIMT